VETIPALQNVSLQVNQRDRVGIVGLNGAGKTTLLRVAAGILTPTSGEVEINGKVIAMIDQSLGLDPQFTGFENIFQLGIFLNQSREKMQERVDDIAEFSGLKDRLKHPLYTYSSGMRARLAFSIATSIEPDILIIDEGLGTADAEFAVRAAERLEHFLKNAGILLLASHSVQLIEKFCNRTVTLDQGHVVQVD